MASQRASITKELLRESLESASKPFKIHSLDDGRFSCVLEFLMCHKVVVNRPTGSGMQLVVSNIRLFSRVHSRRARCEESVLSGYRETRSQKSEDLKTKEHRNLIKNLSLTKHQS